MQIAQTVRLYAVHRSAASCGVSGSLGDKLAIISPTDSRRDEIASALCASQ
jgi:hypothetical protein